ncbi:MAG: response regulator [Chitinispirillaceae bacterium]|nr:response regulator [Chitinispirillaceae bacterium]
MSEQTKVLIVDDDHDTLDLLELFLYKYYDVISAMNGFEALSKVESEHPHIILTDIKMPIMDGIRFLNNLRKHSSTRNIPVVAITSFTQEHTVKSLANLGFSGIITKPPEGEKVLELVTSLMTPPPTETNKSQQPSP